MEELRVHLGCHWGSKRNIVKVGQALGIHSPLRAPSFVQALAGGHR